MSKLKRKKGITKLDLGNLKLSFRQSAKDYRKLFLSKKFRPIDLKLSKEFFIRSLHKLKKKRQRK